MRVPRRAMRERVRYIRDTRTRKPPNRGVSRLDIRCRDIRRMVQLRRAADVRGDRFPI
jgi:hypothetical protein